MSRVQPLTSLAIGSVAYRPRPIVYVENYQHFGLLPFAELRYCEINYLSRPYRAHMQLQIPTYFLLKFSIYLKYLPTYLDI